MNERLRLLPWSGDGKAHLLSPNGGRSFVGELADEVEADQLDMAQDLVDHVQALLDDPSAPKTDWHEVVTGLNEALRDAVRAARSRGDRLSASEGA